MHWRLGARVHLARPLIHVQLYITHLETQALISISRLASASQIRLDRVQLSLGKALLIPKPSLVVSSDFDFKIK